MCSSQLKPDDTQADRFDYVMNVWKRLLSGENVDFNNAHYLNLRECRDVDYCLAYLMREKKCFPTNTNIEKDLEFYFMNLSVEATTRKLSCVAACLALGGVCPFSGDRIFSPAIVRDCLSLMSSCGCNGM